MAKILARSISLVFQPLAMPTLVFAFFLFLMPDWVFQLALPKIYVFLLVLLTTLVIPLISLLLMRLTKSISSFHMEKREERILPFTVISLYYVMTSYLFYLKVAVDYRMMFALSVMTVCVVLLTGITFFWKISAHMIGVSGLLGIVMYFSIKYPSLEMVNYVLMLIIFTGAVASARLYLHAHTPGEIYAGFFLGFTLCFGAFYYMF